MNLPKEFLVTVLVKSPLQARQPFFPGLIFFMHWLRLSDIPGQRRYVQFP